MKPAHVALALLVAVIWGGAFVATKVALERFSPPPLTALRFLIAALPAAVLVRPPTAWSSLTAIGLTLFTGPFLFQLFGMASGVPPHGRCAPRSRVSALPLPRRAREADARTA